MNRGNVWRRELIHKTFLVLSERKKSSFESWQKCAQLCLTRMKEGDRNNSKDHHNNKVNLQQLYSLIVECRWSPSCHLDNFCTVSSVKPKTPHNFELPTTSTGINKSFFYRAHLIWNCLPLDLRKIESKSLFEKKLIDYLWKEILSLANLPSDLLDDLDT